jgi:tetratricopeptide (TPR) repeat protein
MWHGPHHLELPTPATSARSASQASSYSPSDTKRSNKRKPHSSALTIKELEAKAQNVARNDAVNALEYLMQVLEMKRDRFGAAAPETVETQLDIVELNNNVAQELIQSGRTGEVARYLSQNNAFTQHAVPDPHQNSRRLFQRAQMYNNRTCVKKAEGNVRGALKNCEKSLTIMLHLNMLDQLPTCYLNVCALYSTLGLHSEALKHAFLALQILRELIKDTHGKVDLAGNPNASLPTLPDSSILEQESSISHQKGSEPDAEVHFTPLGDVGLTIPPVDSSIIDPAHRRLTTFGTQLAITYFNIAVEQEYLLDFPACIRTYQVAVATAEEFLGWGHPLAKKFRRTLRKALKDEQIMQQAQLEETQTKQCAKYRYGVTSTASVHSVYKNTKLQPLRNTPSPNPVRSETMSPIDFGMPPMQERRASASRGPASGDRSLSPVRSLA